MDKLKDFLWPVVLFGGVGALIDFLIGRAGQAKAKDFLLKWWVRFDDIKWNNFGREEGLFAGEIIQKLFGRRVWSIRRIASAVIVTVFLYVFFALMHRTTDISDLKSAIVISSGTVASIISFSLSISFTKSVTLLVARLCGVSELKNIIFFLIMLIFNYVCLAIWSPLMYGIKLISLIIIGGIIHEFHYRIFNIQFWQDFLHIVGELYQYYTETISLYPNNVVKIFKATCESEHVDAYTLVFFTIGYFASLFRFTMSVLFVGSFLFRPFVLRPISLVWARIVESDKPVFTVIFGGMSALASAVSEATKHL
jgi:hypothetical protein